MSWPEEIVKSDDFFSNYVVSKSKSWQLFYARKSHELYQWLLLSNRSVCFYTSNDLAFHAELLQMKNVLAECGVHEEYNIGKWKPFWC
jgi:hypothetical protein